MQPVFIKTGCHQFWLWSEQNLKFLQLVAVWLPQKKAKDWTRLDFKTLDEHEWKVLKELHDVLKVSGLNVLPRCGVTD